MPKISIITPVYNVQEYLDRCVKSVLSQTFSDFELILIDDGSSDGSPWMCDEWAKSDGRIRVVHQENKGQAAARNRALDIMSGEYVAFIDSDDWVAPRFLEILYNNLVTANADISVCHFVQTQGEDGTVGEINNDATVYGGREFLKHCMENRTGKHWILCDKLFKRECFDGIRMPIGRVYEDNATVYRIIYNAESVSYCTSVLYFYFQRPGSTTNHTSVKRTTDHITMWREMCDFYKSKGDNELFELVQKQYFYVLLDIIPKCVGPIAEMKSDMISEVKKIKEAINVYHPITVKTCPEYYNVIRPRSMKIYWFLSAVKHKLFKD